MKKSKLLLGLVFVFMLIVTVQSAMALNDIWVANYNSNDVSMLDASDGYSKTDYDVGTFPRYLAIDSNNNVWVANDDDDDVSILNASDGYSRTDYAVGDKPRGVVVDSYDNVWVVNYNSNDVSMLNASDGYSKTDYTVGNGPRNVVVDNHDNIWVANYIEDDVSMLNASDSYSRTDYSVGDYPKGMAIEDNDNVWVANSGDDDVSMLDASNGYSRTDYVVGDSPMQVDAETNGNIWIANFNDDDISMLNASDGYSRTDYAVGNGPKYIFAETNGNIWVSNLYDDDVSMFNASNGYSKTNYVVGTSPMGIVASSVLQNNFLITATEPTNNTQFYTENLSINATVDTNSTSYSCSLYLNDTLNQTNSISSYNAPIDATWTEGESVINPANYHDGDWDTYSLVTYVINDTVQYYFNYSSNASITDAKLKYKYGYDGGGDSITKSEFLHSDCITDGTIQVKITQDISNYLTYLSCYNVSSSSFIKVTPVPLDYCDSPYRIYETNMTLYDKSGKINETDVTFNVPFSNTTENSYNYYVNCSNDINSTVSDTNTFYIDNIQPFIDWYLPRDDNKFVLNDQDPNFVTNITLNDSNLYSYEYNLTNMTGANLYTFSSSSLTGLSFYTINHSINMSSYKGVYNATVRVCDGHTAKKIKSIKKIKKYNDKIEFLDNKEDVKIKIKDNHNARSTKIIKKKDRYKFGFKTKTKKNTETFTINSDKYIDILHGKTKYEGHLVTGNRWIDFEKEGVRVTKIKRISSTEIEVTAHSKKKIDDWTFNSIGELNCNTESRTFYSTGIEELTPDVALTSDTVNFKLDITDYNSSSLSNFTANVTFNGTTYTATESDNSTTFSFEKDIQLPLISNNQTYNYTWDYSLNGKLYNYSDNITVYEPKMDDCSDYSTTWVNYLLEDEETTLPVNGSLQYEFNYYVGDYSDSLAGLESNLSTYSFCIYPSWADLYTNVSLTYKESLTSFTSRSYSANGYTVDNSTNNVTLLILGFPSEITFNIIDASENNIEGALIKAYKYDVDTGTDQLVTQAYTDDNGNVVFGLSKGTTKYSFEMYNTDNELQINTSRFKLFSNEYQYVFYDAQETAITEWLRVENNIIGNIYDTDDKIIHFNWTEENNVSEYYYMEVTGNGTTFFSNKNYSTSGYLNYTLPDNNITYNARMMLKTNHGRVFALDTHTVNKRNLWDNIPSSDRIILTAIIFILFVLMGIKSHTLTLLLGNMILIFLTFMGILPFGWAEMAGFIVLSMILFVVTNKEKTR